MDDTDKITVRNIAMTTARTLHVMLELGTADVLTIGIIQLKIQCVKTVARGVTVHVEILVTVCVNRATLGCGVTTHAAKHARPMIVTSQMECVEDVSKVSMENSARKSVQQDVLNAFSSRVLVVVNA